MKVEEDVYHLFKNPVRPAIPRGGVPQGADQPSLPPGWNGELRASKFGVFDQTVLKLLPDLSEGSLGFKANPRRHATQRIVELKTQILADLLGTNDPAIWRQLVPEFLEHSTNWGIQVIISNPGRPDGR